MNIANKSLLKDKCYINGEWINSNNNETINNKDNMILSLKCQKILNTIITQDPHIRAR